MVRVWLLMYDADYEGGEMLGVFAEEHKSLALDLVNKREDTVVNWNQVDSGWLCGVGLYTRYNLRLHDVQ